MIFNSIQFILFFIAVTTTYFLITYRYRWLLLLLASCYFYMAFIPVYILILTGMIIVDYIAGILIENSKGRNRKLFLILSIVSNVGILVFFKYYNFLTDNINGLANIIHWNYSLPLLSIILPIGLSFHTFQALSYTIEVYRGKQKAERHFGIYALYVMFYPQLVAGPIERPQNLLHQFHEEHYFDSKRVIGGLKRMAWGFFKKMVVADHLAIFVNYVFANPHSFNGPVLITGTIFFAFQLYCDFSGYCDIALGAAQVMGIKLMENFRRPYFSKSIPEFWKRWHVSLSSWFKDYVYIPLGGNRVTFLKMYTNLFLVFLISGLWHGANWTYIIWGALHGIYVVLSNTTQNFRNHFNSKIGLLKIPTIHKMMKIGTTFTLVCIGWIFFRANTVDDAWYIFSHLLVGLRSFITNFFSYYTWKNLLSLSGLINKSDLVIMMLGIVVVFLVDMIERRTSIWQKIATYPLYIRWFCYYTIVLAIVIFGRFGAQQFIYFQF